MQKTFTPKAVKATEQKWYIVDATDKVVGKLATRVADALRGKDLPTFTPHMDMGAYVVIINSDKVRFTGKKLEDKIYYRHSGFKGGIKAETAASVMEKNSKKVIVEAIKNMLPNNKLRKHFLAKLKVFKGAEHTHEAQKPVPLEI
ncbi:MAG TPA: 50S ribosomal protein L13 [Candidatus Gracilibacteria bacterium]|nr:50S ribosomal protein L13 [Candidatus Gracilibacteria bacterium]